MVWVIESKRSAQQAGGIGDLAAQIEVELESKKRDLEDAYEERCKQHDEDRAAIAVQYEEQRICYETSFKAELRALTLSHKEELSERARNSAALEASLDEANTQLYAYAAMISNYKTQVEMSCRIELRKNEHELKECWKRVREVEAENTLIKLGRVTRDTKFREIMERNEQLEEASATDRRNLAEISSECEFLKAKVAQANSDHVKAKLAESERDVERLTKAANALRAEKSGLIASYAELKNQHSLSEKEKESKSRSDSLLHEKINTLLSAQAKDRQGAERLAAENSRLTKKQISLDALSVQLKSENSMLSARAKDIKTRVPRLIAEVESARKDSAALSNELSSLRDENATLTKDFNTRVSNNAQLSKLRDTYGAQIKTINEKNTALSGEVSCLKKELQEERKISAEFREECIVLSRSSFS